MQDHVEPLVFVQSQFGRGGEAVGSSDMTEEREAPLITYIQEPPVWGSGHSLRSTALPLGHGVYNQTYSDKHKWAVETIRGGVQQGDSLHGKGRFWFGVACTLRMRKNPIYVPFLGEQKICGHLLTWEQDATEIQFHGVIGMLLGGRHPRVRASHGAYHCPIA